MNADIPDIPDIPDCANFPNTFHTPNMSNMPNMPRTDEIRARFSVQREGFSLTVDLTLPARGITALFGHSGCGKTTCLRALAGLERFAGYCALGSTVWQDDRQGLFVPTHQRAVGYVFQESSLFAHLSVQQNMEFGQKRAATRTRARPHPTAPTSLGGGLAGIAELLGITALLPRRPAQLSGGERQRVAIARALLTAPALLLMDEPLAALDLQRKQEILPYLERLRDELSIPMIYVSHSPDEVARLADHLVLLQSGQVVADGPLSSVWARADLPPAFSDDAGVVLETTVAAHHCEEGLTQLAFSAGRLWVGLRSDAALGQRLRCRIHARDVSLALERPRASSILNFFTATMSAWGHTDVVGHILVQLQLEGGVPMLARITQHSRRVLGLTLGQTVWVQVKAVALLC